MLTNRGFTLIEVLVAIFLVTMGAGGAFALIHQTTRFTASAGSQFEASYLAQEGIEIVRNIRDTNFLKDHKGNETEWTEGLIDPNGDEVNECETGCEADYADTALEASQERFLQRNGGLYNYGTGEETLYKRTITVTQPSADKLEVAVEVTWSDRSVEAATELHNWLQPSS